LKILLTGAHGQRGRALHLALEHHHVGALTHDQLDIATLDPGLACVTWLGMLGGRLSHLLFPVSSASLRRPPEQLVVFAQ
jgi:hypothetical protein